MKKRKGGKLHISTAAAQRLGYALGLTKIVKFEVVADLAAMKLGSKGSWRETLHYWASQPIDSVCKDLGVPIPRAKRKVKAPAKVEANREWHPKVSLASVASDDFLKSYEWRRVRIMALKKYGPRCQCCGATPEDGVKMNVDHIKPRKKFPLLALEVDNLQILCEVCNHGKGNWDETDWRPVEGDKIMEAYSQEAVNERLNNMSSN